MINDTMMGREPPAPAAEQPWCHDFRRGDTLVTVIHWPAAIEVQLPTRPPGWTLDVPAIKVEKPWTTPLVIEQEICAVKEKRVYTKNKRSAPRDEATLHRFRQDVLRGLLAYGDWISPPQLADVMLISDRNGRRDMSEFLSWLHEKGVITQMTIGGGRYRRRAAFKADPDNVKVINFLATDQEC
jgi:hypothetical protein